MSKDLFAGSPDEREADDKRKGRALMRKFRVCVRADNWPERSELRAYARSLTADGCESLKYLAERLQQSDCWNNSGFWQSVYLAAAQVQGENVAYEPGRVPRRV